MKVSEDNIKIAYKLLEENTDLIQYDEENIKSILEVKNDYLNDIQSVIYAILAIKEIYKLPKDYDTGEIIILLSERKIQYEIRYYITYILVMESKLNPFEAINNINDKDIYWSIHHFFDDTFSICEKCEFNIMLKFMKKIFYFTKGDMAQGSIYRNVNEYLKKYIDICENLVMIFMDQPEDYLQVVVMYAVENIMKVDFNKADEYLNKMLEDIRPLIHSTACRIYYVLIDSYLKNSQVLIEKIEKLSNKWTDDNSIGSLVSLLLIFLLKDIPLKETTIIKFKQRIYEFSMKNDSIKFSILLTLNANIKLLSENSNNFISDIFSNLYSTKIGENMGLVQIIDEFTRSLLEFKSIEFVLELIFVFFKENYRIYRGTIFDYLKMSLNQILKNANSIIPFIYKNIFSKNITKINFAITLINQFLSINIYHNINWIKDIGNYDVIKFLKIISTYCYNAEYLSFIGFKLLEVDLDDDSYKRYEDYYLEEIVSNYKSSSKITAETYKCINQRQIDLKNATVNHTREYENIYNKITKIKDFKPSEKRLIDYQKSQLKFNNKIIKDGESKSVFLELCSKRVFKYGKRYSVNILDEDNKINITENEYKHFEYSVELPFMFMIDPLRHFHKRMEALSEVGVENEINN